MTTRPRKVLTAIDSKGVPFSEVHTETLRLDGKWEQNDPVTLANAGPEADEWKELYSAAVSKQYDDEVKAHAETKIQLQEMTTDRDQQKVIADTVPGLQEQITTLQTEVYELTSTNNTLKPLADRVPELEIQIQTLNSSLRVSEHDLSVSKARVLELETAVTNLTTKVSEMSKHPDVIADNKAKAIREAKAAKERAIAEKVAAEAKLAELGEVVDSDVEDLTP